MIPVLLARLALGQAGFGPFESPAAPVTSEAAFEKVRTHEDQSTTSNPLYLAFEVYRLTITVFDGPRCAHRPVCSVYGLQAVERHGLLGLFLAVDRLWREDESSALRPLPQVWERDRPFFADPLDASDFWLRNP